MNVSLDLSASQLSKLRNGHGIRVSRAMFGGGVDMIIDPMTFNNLMKKFEKGKGAVISMSGSEIEQIKWKEPACSLVLVINRAKYQELRMPVSGVISVMTQQEWELILVDMDTNNFKKQQIL